MMKGMLTHQYHQQQQQQLQLVDENMSNLTSASGEASVSSNQQSSFASPAPNPPKKKRNLPGNPDPDAEVIALSPKTLMATNRFVCEICNKGFQRDQNLQLHRRGHNLPWKLKQRSSKEVRKKVYICPEVGCVHHDPSRALGDLTGIKKHFSRKHGEKKWKCDKCSKKYAVQSDWKAHSKICGTREYRCDCGTIFSRRDSFITHRAFCDALAEESARAIAANPLANHHHPFLFSQPHDQPFPQLLREAEANPSINVNSHGILQQAELSLKREQQQQQQQNLNMRAGHMPPWLACQEPTSLSQLDLPSLYSNPVVLPHPSLNTPPPLVQAPGAAAPSPHMSATALLQKAAEMGATMSRPSHLSQMASHTTNAAAAGSAGSPALLQEMVMNSLASAPAGFDGCNYEDAFGEMLGSKRDEEASKNNLGSSTRGHGEEGGDGMMTRDFLGLKAFSHRDILKLQGQLDPCMSKSQWQG
ncbi:protein indeterminate-domain 7 [Canna indica]|uniref:Protein EARLY HEADING DATE 2 n=1 Tax=Canna indica TaxID=4628 RepID=A0AAQ3JQC8_9LILI|nr:protein indeterminate-domain 7 [Canna indica]